MKNETYETQKKNKKKPEKYVEYNKANTEYEKKRQKTKASKVTDDLGSEDEARHKYKSNYYSNKTYDYDKSRTKNDPERMKKKDKKYSKISEESNAEKEEILIIKSAFRKPKVRNEFLMMRA